MTVCARYRGHPVEEAEVSLLRATPDVTARSVQSQRRMLISDCKCAEEEAGRVDSRDRLLNPGGAGGTCW